MTNIFFVLKAILAKSCQLLPTKATCSSFWGLQANLATVWNAWAKGLEQRKRKQRLAQQMLASQEQLLQLSFNSWQQSSKQSKVRLAARVVLLSPFFSRMITVLQHKQITHMKKEAKKCEGFGWILQPLLIK